MFNFQKTNSLEGKFHGWRGQEFIVSFIHWAHPRAWRSTEYTVDLMSAGEKEGVLGWGRAGQRPKALRPPSLIKGARAGTGDRNEPTTGRSSPDNSMGSLSTDLRTWSDSPVRELSSILRSLPWMKRPSAGRRSPGRRKGKGGGQQGLRGWRGWNIPFKHDCKEELPSGTGCLAPPGCRNQGSVHQRPMGS